MFWERFSDMCASVGKAPNAVAKELGIPSGSITAWKNGATPRNSTAKNIADYFGVRVEFLLYGGHPEEAKEKSPTPFGVELSETKKKLIEKIYLMDEKTVDALNAIADQVLSKQGK